MRGTSPTAKLDAGITGAEYVDLVVGGAGDGNGHGEWADGNFHCAG